MRRFGHASAQGQALRQAKRPGVTNSPQVPVQSQSPRDPRLAWRIGTFRQSQRQSAGMREPKEAATILAVVSTSTGLARDSAELRSRGAILPARNAPRSIHMRWAYRIRVFGGSYENWSSDTLDLVGGIEGQDSSIIRDLRHAVLAFGLPAQLLTDFAQGSPNPHAVLSKTVAVLRLLLAGRCLQVPSCQQP